MSTQEGTTTARKEKQSKGWLIKTLDAPVPHDWKGFLYDPHHNLANFLSLLIENEPDDMNGVCVITGDGLAEATLCTDVLYSNPGIGMDGLIVLLRRLKSAWFYTVAMLIQP